VITAKEAVARARAIAVSLRQFTSERDTVAAEMKNLREMGSGSCASSTQERRSLANDFNFRPKPIDAPKRAITDFLLAPALETNQAGSRPKDNAQPQRKTEQARARRHPAFSIKLEPSN
jgi:hypothetical protein